MRDLSKSIMSIIGVIFAVVLLLFTGTQTYALLYAVSGSHITAAVGLVLFEAGLIYWWLEFQHDAEGLLQMGIALLMFMVCLLLVTGATALNLGAVEETFLGSDTPAKIITIAALIQLAAKLVYPLVGPERYRQITEKAQEGKILRETHRRFEHKIDDIARELSNELADEWLTRARLDIMTRWSGASSATIVPGDAIDVTPLPDVKIPAAGQGQPISDLTDRAMPVAEPNGSRPNA